MRVKVFLLDSECPGNSGPSSGGPLSFAVVPAAQGLGSDRRSPSLRWRCRWHHWNQGHWEEVGFEVGGVGKNTVAVNVVWGG